MCVFFDACRKINADGQVYLHARPHELVEGVLDCHSVPHDHEMPSDMCFSIENLKIFNLVQFLPFQYFLSENLLALGFQAAKLNFDSGLLLNLVLVIIL